MVTLTSGMFIRDLNLNSDFCKMASCICVDLFGEFLYHLLCFIIVHEPDLFI